MKKKWTPGGKYTASRQINNTQRILEGSDPRRHTAAMQEDNSLPHIEGKQAEWWISNLMSILPLNQTVANWLLSSLQFPDSEGNSKY